VRESERARELEQSLPPEGMYLHTSAYVIIRQSSESLPRCDGLHRASETSACVRFYPMSSMGP